MTVSPGAGVVVPRRDSGEYGLFALADPPRPLRSRLGDARLAEPVVDRDVGLPDKACHGSGGHARRPEPD
jgi:hypothetical protein